MRHEAMLPCKNVVRCCALRERHSCGAWNDQLPYVLFGDGRLGSCAIAVPWHDVG